MDNVTVRRYGAMAAKDGVMWRVWAPKAKRVELVLPAMGDRRVEMAAEVGGEFVATVAGAGAGTRYGFLLNGASAEALRADPASLWQPEGPENASAVVLPETFTWSDRTWKGVARDELVFYELHVGTFTAEGTFEAIIPRLASLKELGVTAIELMPVAQFSGERNWGYDGVLPYAAQNNYGGPAGLQKLVDAAHRTGLGIFLDVVYNHVGPEHSYLDEFGGYFNDAYKTPWGRAVNFDGKGSDAVREYVLGNVGMWLEEFHFDGLRLDAVHAIYDLGATHILKEVADVAKAVEARTGRKTHIVAESDLNDPRVVRAAEVGGHGIDAQWSDDFHHAAHAYLTTETRGYYRDYGQREHLAKVLLEPFLYAGHYSSHRGRKHGAPATGISGDHFVICLQNHDQVGNRAKGERLTALVSDPAKLRLGACLMLFAPHLPMLFMGEEYAEQRPFPFFCSFCGEELKQAVREGRNREFADFVEKADEIPVPDAEETFESAKLTWAWPEGSVHAGMRRLYQDLLKARREWPALRDFVNRSSRLLPEASEGPLLELVRGEGNGAVRIYFNLGETPVALPATKGRVIFSSEESTYGGKREALSEIRNVVGFECVAFDEGGGASPG